MTSAKESLRQASAVVSKRLPCSETSWTSPVVFLTANGDQEPVSSQQIVAAVESALTE